MKCYDTNSTVNLHFHLSKESLFCSPTEHLQTHYTLRHCCLRSLQAIYKTNDGASFCQ